MNQLMLNTATHKALLRFIEKPHHALMLTGPAGSGKFTIAKAIAAVVLGLKSVERLEAYPYFAHLVRADKKKDIPIESIRHVIGSLERKTPGDKPIRRVVLIENAHDLSLPAQNALLKVLEEPPADTLFILTAIESLVLPTIISRSFPITISSIPLKTALTHFSPKDPKSIESNWLLSQGRAGLLSALLEAEKDHPLKQAVIRAKAAMSGDAYDVLKQLEQSTGAPLDLTYEGLDRVLSAAQRVSLYNNSKAKQVLKLRRQIQGLKAAKAASANERLMMLELALNLKD